MDTTTPQYFKFKRQTIGTMGAFDVALKELSTRALAGAGGSVVGSQANGGPIALDVPYYFGLVAIIASAIRAVLLWVIERSAISNALPVTIASVNVEQKPQIVSPSDIQTNDTNNREVPTQ